MYSKMKKSIHMNIHLSFLTAVVLLAFCACGEKLIIDSQPKPGTYFFSFENDMEGWEKRAIDLELGDTLIDWSIERTDEMVYYGKSALKFYLENYNDAGKIWIERPFVVKPNQNYRVEVTYAFASADFGLANLWTIITGVVTKSPETRDDLVYQGHTGNGSDTDIGFKWLAKNYNFDVTSDSDGTLYVIVGVWGTWEGPRTYYLDFLHIDFTLK